MTTWLSSDHHYGHTNIIKYCARPFKDVHEMNLEMTRRHNEVVKDDDEVIFVGDFCLDERLAKKVGPLLKGRKKLIPGNHDKCHSCHKAHLKARREYEEWGFEVLPERVVQDFPFGRVLLCHMPLRYDNVFQDERYKEHRPEVGDLNESGSMYLVHGHVHEKWKRRGRMVNIGVDVWDFRPVSVGELGEYILSTNPA